MFMNIVIWAALVIVGVAGSVGALVYYSASQNTLTLGFWGFVSGCIVLVGYSFSRIVYRVRDIGHSTDDLLQCPQETLESALMPINRSRQSWELRKDDLNVIDFGTAQAARFLRTLPKHDEKPFF